MYTKDELVTLEKIPKLDELSLKIICDFYSNHICNYSYEYELSGNKNIKIRFFKENLCHLLGIHKVVPQQTKGFYIGNKGYEKIESDSLTIDDLIKMNEKEFNKIKLRITAFHYIYKLLRQADMVKFYPERTRKYSRLRSEFIIYDEKNNFKIHLGILKEQNEKDIYVPETYIVISCKDKRKDYYTEGQEYVKIINRNIELIKSI